MGSPTGNSIRIRRKAVRLTQEQLAKKASLHLTTVIRAEADENITRTSLRAIEQALDAAESNRARSPRASPALPVVDHRYEQTSSPSTEEVITQVTKILTHALYILASLSGPASSPTDVSARRPRGRISPARPRTLDNR